MTEQQLVEAQNVVKGMQVKQQPSPDWMTVTADPSIRNGVVYIPVQVKDQSYTWSGFPNVKLLIKEAIQEPTT